MELEFTSWWWENSQKQMIIVKYVNDSRQMTVKLKDLDPIPINSPQLANGKDLDVWDLFVGSEIDVLGKPTILKQCDAKTSLWNAKHGKKLMKIRQKLIEEIRKYDTKPFPQRLLVSYFNEIAGGLNLKGIMVQIAEFREILMHYRPDLASRIVQNDQNYQFILRY